MVKLQKVLIFFILIYFFISIPKSFAKYIFLDEMQIEFQIENLDSKFDSVIISSSDSDEKTIFTIDAVDYESGIAKLEFYINNQIYKTFEYNEIVKEKTELVEVEIENVPFYAECYAIGTDNEGHFLKSNVIIPNYFKIYNLNDLIKFRELQNTNQVDFEGENIYLMNDIDLISISNWEPISTTTNPFKGKFHGNSHMIFNLNMETISGCKGLFAQNNGTISELTVSRKHFSTYL